MLTTQNIKLDFAQRDITQRIAAVQGDSYTRVLDLSLYENEMAWDMPVGASAFLRFRKPDGTGGMYDTLPDGTQAWSAQGNVVRFTLAPQVLAVPGAVQAQLEIVKGDACIASFTFLIEVAVDPSVGVLDSEDYVSWNAWALQSLENLFFVGAESPGVKPALWFDTSRGSPKAQITVFDKDGNQYLLHPVTQIGCVDGLEDALSKKAPAGYGYGEAVQLLRFDNDTDGSLLEARLDNLIAQMGNREIRQISISDYPALSGATFYGSIYRHMEDYVMISMCSYERDCTKIFKTKNDGVWQPWEWVNPPMILGQKYRTTERNNGKPVYTRLVNCGTLANGESVPLGVSNIIRFAAYATNGTVYPFQTPDSAYWRQVIIQGSNLIMLCGSEAVGADTVYCQIWYTED